MINSLIRHEQHIDEFVSYGLPESSLLIYLVGLLELVDGPIHPGLAPTLAVVMMFLIWAGPRSVLP